MPSFHEPGKDSMHLCWLFTPENKRNCGYATAYLYKVAQDTITLGLTCITLDDVSTNHRQKHNIYLKLGFRYVDPDGGPQMIARASTVSRLAKMFL